MGVQFTYLRVSIQNDRDGQVICLFSKEELKFFLRFAAMLGVPLLFSKPLRALESIHLLQCTMFEFHDETGIKS